MQPYTKMDARTHLVFKLSSSQDGWTEQAYFQYPISLSEEIEKGHVNEGQTFTRWENILATHENEKKECTMILLNSKMWNENEPDGVNLLHNTYLLYDHEFKLKHIRVYHVRMVDYSQHRGRKCRQCEPAWDPCPGSVGVWRGHYSRSSCPPPLSRTETTENQKLMRTWEKDK